MADGECRSTRGVAARTVRSWRDRAGATACHHGIVPRILATGDIGNAERPEQHLATQFIACQRRLPSRCLLCLLVDEAGEALRIEQHQRATPAFEETLALQMFESAGDLFATRADPRRELRMGWRR